MSDSVPAELFVVVCEALEAAQGELEQLDDPEFDMPLPGEVWDGLNVYEVCARVLERIYASTSDDGRRKIDAMAYEEREARSELIYTHNAVPVSGDIIRELEEARRTVERRAISDPEVRRTLREVLPNGWAW